MSQEDRNAQYSFQKMRLTSIQQLRQQEGY
jgi:hypothetical protein